MGCPHGINGQLSTITNKIVIGVTLTNQITRDVHTCWEISKFVLQKITKFCLPVIDWVACTKNEKNWKVTAVAV